MIVEKIFAVLKTRNVNDKIQTNIEDLRFEHLEIQKFKIEIKFEN